MWGAVTILGKETGIQRRSLKGCYLNYVLKDKLEFIRLKEVGQQQMKILSVGQKCRKWPHTASGYIA